MFLSIQFPITDLRVIFGNTNTLFKPNWPDPDVENALRHFGSIGQRSKGGVVQWPAEEKFCISRNAINIKDLTKQTSVIKGKKIFFEGRFRRFFKPGDFTCKYELGLISNSDYVVNSVNDDELNQGDYDKVMEATLKTFFNLNVKIEKATKKTTLATEDKKQKLTTPYTELKLFQAGDKLAELFLSGSTKRKYLKASKKWWIQAGEPLTLLTYHNEGKIKLPANAILVNEIKEYGIELYSLMYPVTKNRLLRCWLIGVDPAKKTKQAIDFLRSLRINLFRINAEKEAMRHVLNAVTADTIKLDEKIVNNNISPFLEAVTANLLKRRRYGIEQQKIIDYALRSDELAIPGSMETLLNRLQPLVNKYVLKNVERLITPEQKQIKIFIASSAEVTAEWEKSVLVITKVNKSHKHLFLEPVRWEYDMVYANYPENKDIQDAINPKLKESDLIIFIFYSRIGKYTRQEFELANEEKKRFFAYFKKGFIPDEKTTAMYNDLVEFKNSLNDTVLYKEFASMNEFDSYLSDNLHLYLSEKYPPSEVIAPIFS